MPLNRTLNEVNLQAKTVVVDTCPTGQGKVSVISSTNPAVLGKTFSLDGSGMQKKVAGNLVEGFVDVLSFENITSFVSILTSIGVHQALCSSLPITGKIHARIVTKQALAKCVDSHAIARSKSHFAFPAGQPGVLTLDYDPPDSSTVLTHDQLCEILFQVAPQARSAGIASWCSGSSHIFLGEAEVQGLRGQRIYITVSDLSDIERCGDVLARRLWLRGYGRILVSKSGSKLIRSTFDEAMYQPARLDFIGGAVCKPPLQQRRGEPRVISDGGWLDTRSAFPDLSPQELDEYTQLLHNAKERCDDASSKAQSAWFQDLLPVKTKELEQNNISSTRAVERAIQCLRSAQKGTLNGDFSLMLDDGSKVSVEKILDHPTQYDGRFTRDPMEPDYQNAKVVGKLYLHGANKRLHSFAHGGTTYTLRRRAKRLQVVAGRRHELVDSILQTLAKEGDIFVKGGKIVQVLADGMDVLDIPKTGYVVGSKIDLFRTDEKGVERSIDIPKGTSEVICAIANRALEQLKACTSHPYARADGSIVDTPGFDTLTKIYANFLPDACKPIPLNPSEQDVLEALQALWRPWRKFPFASDTDRGAMLAAIFTTICRPSLTTAPAFFIDAPVQGSGKSYIAQALGALSNGRHCGSTPFVAGENCEAETLKKVTSMLMSGAGFWLIDNVKGTWKSAVLSALITDGAISDRLLGGNVFVRNDARMLVCATGNNASLDKDLGRRFIKIRIDSKMENPQGRDFDFNPVQLAEEERFDIARSVLIVIKAFTQAGRPCSGRGTAGFGEWSALVRQCVLWCAGQGYTVRAGIGSCGDPAESILEHSGEDDPDNVALSALLLGAKTAFSGQKFQAREIFKIFDKNRYKTSDRPEEVWILDALAYFLPSKQVTAMAIGKILSNRRHRVAGNLKFEDCGVDSDGTKFWTVASV
jgi:hypothetical protein